MAEKYLRDCPFCNDDGGCCFCDYSGKIYVGDSYAIRTLEQYNDLRRPIPLLSDLRKLYDSGGLDHIGKPSPPQHNNPLSGHS